MPSQQRKVSLALALAMLAPGAALGRRPPSAETAPAKAGPGQGRVEYVTDKRAYLDHGADGGLVAGQTVALFRSGRPAGSCTVEASSARRAACVGGRPRVGDTYRLGRAAVAKTVVAPRALPAVVPAEALAADALAIAGAEVSKVDFAGEAAFGARRAVELSVGYASFGSGDPETDYRQERIEGTLRLPLGQTGLRLDAAFTALRWRPRPETTRFRPGQDTQFYLWEAEIVRRDGEARTVVAAGRLWPWHTPGLSVLDGIQLGRRSADRATEWGAYGGTIPDPLSLVPSADAWAAGLYGAFTQPGTKAELLRLAREEARVGLRHVAGVGTVGEAELLAQAWLGWSTLGTGGRLLYLAGGQRRPSVDRGYVDLRVQPSLTAGGGLSFRYLGPALDDAEALLRNVSPALEGGYHAAGDAHWDPLAWLGMGVYGDLNRDATSGLSGRLGGVELRLPRLFGELGGLWLGGEAAEGWIRSRTGYAQLLGHVGRRLRLLARASATGSDFTTPDPNLDTREVDGFLQLDAGVASWLRLRGRVLVRAPLTFDEGARPPTGLVLDVDATGIF